MSQGRHPTRRGRPGDPAELPGEPEYPGELHWYDLPDDDAELEDDRPAPRARWRLSRALTVLAAWRGRP
ncbi:hypothetical protein GCM10010106_29820 [Thermopolyspora flexuosa]|uniref:Uncharacterized protein n=1 Tax=Thermopolyspora flexuosa TaxID=103836 RepID=A0A543ISA4_9ACTN|nr:hypothetical protein [Thermopolyspora flexuosa]TQM73448.1 hypothetical protein FHX40_0088 [Thermopolyspora flexuosa]GGM81225.1 hypothetical protein GCM10010106_29820 [Thermopolyspora flexuosa]